MNFDASIDLLDSMLPPEDVLSNQAAADRVRAAVGALPGAGWISVEVCRGLPPVNPRWLTIYKRGRGHVLEGGEWDEVAERIEAAVRAALA